ncbi:PilW family protein [Alkalibacterium sp. 20]|uniref:PilW family protein n=1 Tax=Alkalibacterium sp. 20 TaxID=1798803 RepID=UPI00090042B4|nr:prepilin-type N-terminal cleavage/methylation domain-containing protein [Alkalibacterium sp. 20]OJF90901.1 hypothetical protein AX762_03785 [Alkalibacterium sp. 20]
MRKWKRDYLLKNKLNKNSSWKSDKGFTLVELLASIALLSVVILLAGSVHIFGQKQFISQTESASQANDMSYALSVMSRDLRKEAFLDVTVEGNTIKILGDPVFEKEGQRLLKNGNTLSSSINDMTVNRSDEDRSLEIVLRSSRSQTQQKEYRTTIYFRR